MEAEGECESSSSSDSSNEDSSSGGSDDQEDSCVPNESRIEVRKISNSRIEQIGDRILIKEVNVNVMESPLVHRSGSSRNSIVSDETNFNMAQQYLIKRYSKQLSKLTPISWCPSFRQDMSMVYTNLHIKATNKNFKFVDDSKIPLQEIFKQCTKVAPDDLISIFIEGAHGYGKTTLASKIAYDWAMSYNGTDDTDYVKGFSLVIVIALRKFQGVDIEDYLFKEVFPSDFNSSRKRRSLLKMLEVRKEKILFILDGYDELKGDASKELLLQIVDRKFLSNCSIVLTSQPNRMNEVLEYCNLRLKIAGYEYECAQEYITKYCRDNNIDDACLLKELGRSNDSIYRELSACPLLLLLLCVLAEEKGGKLPSKTADVLNELINCVIKRSMAKVNRQVDHPTCHYKDVLCKLGQVSLLALLHDQSYLTSYELQMGDSMQDVLDLGLFSQASNATVMHTTNIYEPLHRIFMEFLAALYIVSIIDNTDLINNKLNSIFVAPRSMPFTLIFLSGLLADDAYKLFDILPQDVFLNDQTLTMVLLQEAGRKTENVRSILRLLPQHDIRIGKQDVMLSGWTNVLVHCDCYIKTVRLILDLDEQLHSKYLEIVEAIGNGVQIESAEMILNCDHAMEMDEAERIASYVNRIAASTTIKNFLIDVNDIETVTYEKYSPVIASLCSLIGKSKSLLQISVDLELSHQQICEIKASLLLSTSIVNVSFPFLCCSKGSIVNLSEILHVPNGRICKFGLTNYQEKKDGLSIQRSLSINSDGSAGSNGQAGADDENSCGGHDTAIHHLMRSVMSPGCLLNTLDLSNCSCSLSDYQCIGRAIGSSSARITSLVMHGTSSFAQVRPILTSLTTDANSSLRHLDLTSHLIVISDDHVADFCNMLDRCDHYLSLRTLILARWRCVIHHRTTAQLFLKILRHFKYLEVLDISRTVTHLEFHLESGIYEQLKRARFPHRYQLTFVMDHVMVVITSTRRRKAHVAQCFPLAFFFPAQRVDCRSCGSDHPAPFTDSEFRRVFKTMSKMPQLVTLNMQDWKVCLHEPDKLFDCIRSYLQKSGLKSIDISNLGICDSSGRSLFNAFFACLLASLQSLEKVTISVQILTKDMSKQLVCSILDHLWGKKLIILLTNDGQAVNDDLDCSVGDNCVHKMMSDSRAQHLVDALGKTYVYTEIDPYCSEIKILATYSGFVLFKKHIFGSLFGNSS